jgi:hypothetical protein
VSDAIGRRAAVYEHQATVLSHATAQKRGLFPQANRHVIDWNGRWPAMCAI